MNTKKGLIGVIVPVYKVEKYIAECIESILAQTYTKFRLILVDDGTPDNAGKICDEYAKKDSRITVIHQENAGVTRARARGVVEAKDCEWITFVDGDDTIAPDALEHLYSYTNNETDIILSPIDGYVDPRTIRIKNIDYRKLVVSNTSFADTPWGKLINRDLFTEFAFSIPPEIKVDEDNLMNIRLAFNSDKDVFICEHNIYNYQDNANSITKTFYRNLDYYSLVHKHRLASIPIPEIDNYLLSTIPKRLLRWRENFMYKVYVKGMKNNGFYTELKNDIHKTGYKLPVIDHILFHNTNPTIRYFAIFIKKLQNLVRCKIQQIT